MRAKIIMNYIIMIIIEVKTFPFLLLKTSTPLTISFPVNSNGIVKSQLKCIIYIYILGVLS